MEEQRYYYAEGSRCAECGEDLGRHKVWQLVFSDDPPEILESTLSGEINRVPCPHCGFEGAWLWPPIFLYVDLTAERAVGVTLMTGARQQINMLCDALETDQVRQRGLNSERLLPRTKIVTSYRDIAEALQTPLKRIEQENLAILAYIERKDLTGVARVKRLVEAAISSDGAVSLELEELTPEFLDEVEKYRDTLTGEEDPRVQQTLDQVIPYLRERLIKTRKSLPRRDERTALADVLKSSLTATPRNIIESLFEGHFDEGKLAALQLRVLRLCTLQAQGSLKSISAAPIDFSPELSNLVNELIAGRGLERTILSGIHLKALPEVKDFLDSLVAATTPKGLPEAPPHFTGPPPPWLSRANDVLEEIVNSMGQGAIPMTVFDSIADQPMAQAYVHAELGRMLVEQDQASGAMHNFLEALRLIETSVDTTSPPDYAINRLHAVCLERRGKLQLQYGRLEDSILDMRAARVLYEEIGATDGIAHSLRDEAFIWFSLGRVAEAEELFITLSRLSEGSATADEVRDLANFANVYRFLRPWATAELNYAQTAPGDPDSELSAEENEPTSEEDVPTSETPFEQKGGIAVSVSVEGHDELSMTELLGSEQMRLLYRALAVATLNGDTRCENLIMGRMLVVYGEYGCKELAAYILERILERTTLESAGVDAQLFAFNQLGGTASSQEGAGDFEGAVATRREQLQIMDFILASEDDMPQLAVDEMRGEKACLLESLDQPDAARDEYSEAIRRLEKSRKWMRDPENKRGLQSRRWRPYVRAARNSLRMYTRDQTRIDLLIDAWNHIQAGRSRAMLDAIASEQTDDMTDAGVASVRPMTFEDISSHLSKDMVILEYVLMPSSGGCPGSWSLFAIEPHAKTPWLVWQEPDMDRVYNAQHQLAEVADELEQMVLADGFSSLTSTLNQKYVSALEDLADVLIPAGLLDNLESRGYRQLVIVADAYLHDVPFAALRPIQAGERNYLGLPNSRGGFQIVHAPSSSIFAHWNVKVSQKKSGDRRSAALFIDPLGDLTKSNPHVTTTFSTIESCLRGREVEVTRLDGKAATPHAWLHESRDCDLVVYFGHSIAGTQHGGRAALTLSDGSIAVAPITADDIYKQATRPIFSRHTMFILASCSGGTVSAGGWDSDRELRGLSTAHLYAGSGAVIAASRPLLDSPTLALLEVLVTAILSGHDGAASLAEAQQKMAASQSTFAHPHFWGYVGFMGAPDWRLST